jgi:hypothetical protein
MPIISIKFKPLWCRGLGNGGRKKSKVLWRVGDVRAMAM